MSLKSSRAPIPSALLTLLSTLATALFFSSQASAQGLPVSTISMEQREHYQIERVYGGQLRPRRMSNMGFETGGTIAEVHIEEGQAVVKGELLISLDQSVLRAELTSAMADLATARAELQAQQVQLELAGTTLERNRQLAASNHVSEQLLDELAQQYRINEAQVNVAATRQSFAEATIHRIEVNLAKTVLVAPYDSIVQTRFANEGSIIGPGTTAVSLVENNEIEAVIGIPESAVGVLEIGNDYEFVVNKRVVPGRLKSLLPQVDATTGTVTAIFGLTSPKLFTGSLAEVRLATNIAETGFWIPITALTESQRGLWSVLAVEGSPERYVVTPRLVEIIYQGQESVYVRGSISPGDLIIDSGTGRVVPGQQVSISSSAPYRSIDLSSGPE